MLTLSSSPGKTLVCKEKAIQLDVAATSGKNVYFISLLGANGEDNGKPYRFPFVFDLVTKWYDFRNTNAKFVDVRRLCDHYEKTTGKGRLYVDNYVDIYRLSLQFIADHPNSNYIFDEVPFIKNGKYKVTLRKWT